LAPLAGEFRPQLAILETLIVNGFRPHLVADDGRHSSPVSVVRPGFAAAPRWPGPRWRQRPGFVRL